MQELVTYIVIWSAVAYAGYAFYKSVKTSRECNNVGLSCASCALKENCSEKLTPIKIQIK